MQKLFSRTSKSHFVIFSIGLCPTFLSEAKPALLFVLIQKVSKKIKAPFYLFLLTSELFLLAKLRPFG
jgi:hypothetical protein